MEDKIKEFIEYLDSNPAYSWEDVVRKAIQFGSQLTAERAKEKVKPFINIISEKRKSEVLQAIEDSVIK